MLTKKNALFVSVGIHIVVFGSIWLWANSHALYPLPPTTIEIKLAKLGKKKRDPKLLPRIDTAPKPKPPKKTVKKTSKPKPPPKPLDILKKRFGKVDKHGDPEGNIYGSSFHSELANSYELQVVEILRQHYEIPRIINMQEAEKLKVWVRLWIDQAGNLMKIKVQTPSENVRFDQAVLSGSEKIASLGAPPLPLRSKYQNQGLLIQFCPLECL